MYIFKRYAGAESGGGDGGLKEAIGEDERELAILNGEAGGGEEDLDAVAGEREEVGKGGGAENGGGREKACRDVDGQWDIARGLHG
jgi:hypothetical protein